MTEQPGASSSPASTLVGVALLAASGVVAIGYLVRVAHRGIVAVDFRDAYLPAARAAVHGASPFAAAPHWVYPPAAAFLYAPFTVMPATVAAWAATFATLALLVVALVVLGVTDLRCYAVALLSLPVLVTVQTANATAVLVLGAAVLWRFRDRRTVSGITAGLLVAVKPFAWPLLIFVLLRRRSSGAVSIVTTALVTAGGWAAVGFSGLTAYPHLLATVGRAESSRSYTVTGLLEHLAAPLHVAVGIGYLAGAVVFCAALRVRNDRKRFVLMLAATLMLTPTVNVGYFALLLVAAAVTSRELAPVWLAMLASSATLSVWAVSTSLAAGGLAIFALTISLALWPVGRRSGDGRRIWRTARQPS